MSKADRDFVGPPAPEKKDLTKIDLGALPDSYKKELAEKDQRERILKFKVEPPVGMSAEECAIRLVERVFVPIIKKVIDATFLSEKIKKTLKDLAADRLPQAIVDGIKRGLALQFGELLDRAGMSEHPKEKAAMVTALDAAFNTRPGAAYGQTDISIDRAIFEELGLRRDLAEENEEAFTR